MSAIRRPEDMSPDGYLELFQQDDGDIIVEIYSTEGGVAQMISVEFCLSGGRSPWTLEALRHLMEAMRKDERREPWPADESVCAECVRPLGDKYYQDVPSRGDLCLSCHALEAP